MVIRVHRLQNFKSYICNPVMSPCVPLPKKSIKFNRHAAWRVLGMPDMDVVTSYVCWFFIGYNFLCWCFLSNLMYMDLDCHCALLIQKRIRLLVYINFSSLSTNDLQGGIWLPWFSFAGIKGYPCLKYNYDKQVILSGERERKKCLLKVRSASFSLTRSIVCFWIE